MVLSIGGSGASVTVDRKQGVRGNLSFDGSGLTANPTNRRRIWSCGAGWSEDTGHGKSARVWLWSA